jgi:hypothetical protein
MIRRWIWLSLLAILLNSGSASAFYFPGWPGALRPPAPSLLYSSTGDIPPSVRDPLPTEQTTGTNPPGVPEPSTLVMAAIGMGVMFRRMKCLTRPAEQPCS